MQSFKISIMLGQGKVSPFNIFLKKTHHHFLQNWAIFLLSSKIFIQPTLPKIFTQPSSSQIFFSVQPMKDFHQIFFTRPISYNIFIQHSVSKIFYWAQFIQYFHSAHFIKDFHSALFTKDFYSTQFIKDFSQPSLSKKHSVQNHGCYSKPELWDLVLFDIVPPPLSTLMTLDVQEIRCQGENLATWYFTGQCIVASLYGEFFFITFSVLVIFSL